MPSEHFSAAELMCHGASQGHCGCGPETANNVSPLLLEKLEALYRDGLITKIEYEQKRREILNEL